MGKIRVGQCAHPNLKKNGTHFLEKVQMILVVYGNFRRGQPLHNYIAENRVMSNSFVTMTIKTTTLSGIRLHVLGQAPGAVLTHNRKDKAVVELLEIRGLTPQQKVELLRQLDIIEGVNSGLYERCIVRTPLGVGYIYIWKNLARETAEGMRHRPIITDWVEWQKKSMEEKQKALDASVSTVILTITSK